MYHGPLDHNELIRSHRAKHLRRKYRPLLVWSGCWAALLVLTMIRVTEPVVSGMEDIVVAFTRAHPSDEAQAEIILQTFSKAGRFFMGLGGFAIWFVGACYLALRPKIKRLKRQGRL